MQHRYLIIQLDNRLFAVALDTVLRVLWVVDILPVPDSPPGLEGVINLHGEIVPVFNIRHWLRLPPKKLELTDRLILIQSKESVVAFLVDSVLDIMEPKLIDIMRALQVNVKSKILQGVLELNGEAVYLCNLESIPELDEPDATSAALLSMRNSAQDES